MKTRILVMATAILLAGNVVIEALAQENIKALIKKIETMDVIDANIVRNKDTIAVGNVISTRISNPVNRRPMTNIDYSQTPRSIVNITIKYTPALEKELVAAFRKDQDKAINEVEQRKEGKTTHILYKFEDSEYSFTVKDDIISIQATEGRLSARRASQEPDFFVRSITTFGSNDPKTSPLILINGEERTKADLESLRAGDIESFSIIKDSTATSLYGPRGTNGVILISTKRTPTEQEIREIFDQMRKSMLKRDSIKGTSKNQLDSDEILYNFRGKTNDRFVWHDSTFYCSESPLSVFESYKDIYPDIPTYNIFHLSPIVYDKNYEARWTMINDSLFIYEVNPSTSVDMIVDLKPVEKLTGKKLINHPSFDQKIIFADWYSGTLFIKNQDDALNESQHNYTSHKPSYKMTIENGKIKTMEQT